MAQRVKSAAIIHNETIKRILIRGTNWVGDAVMTLPAVEAVKENFPSSELIVLSRPWVVPVYENNPAVDKVLPYRQGRGYLSRISEIFKVSSVIKHEACDLAILLQNAFEAALISYISGIKIRVGYKADGRSFLLSHAIVRDKQILEMHQVEYYLSILRAVGWKAESRNPRLSIDHEDVKRAVSLLETKGIGSGDYILGLSPGAVYGPAKRWPADRFATIADLAAESWGAKVILFGSEGEGEICESVVKAMRHKSLNFAGRTSLKAAMALIEQCDMFVSNDSGLMHVAAALDVPVVAVFGSTNPTTTGPGSDKARIVRQKAECSPCLKPECPTDFYCMLDIGPDDVWKDMKILKEEIG